MITCNRSILRMISLTLVFLFISFITFAQSGTIKGTVKDASGQVMPGASVQVQGTKTGTVADNNGNYSLSVSPGKHILIVSFAGYITERTEILVTQSGVTDLNIMLKDAGDLCNITVVGSRNLSRTKVESPVPVDVIPVSAVINEIGQVDVNQILTFIAPSFQSSRQTVSDGTDHVDPAQLRGLGSDQVLVLVNGKRRHQSALVNVNGTVNRGQVGTDMSAIPATSIDRIEILRDGASAQYGSDAIAGVINIILKKDINHWTVNAGWSGYYDNKFNSRKVNAGNQYYSGNAIDGNTFSLSVNNGVAIGKKGGFVNFSLDFLTQAKTYRQVDTANWQTKKYALPYLNTGRRAYG